MPAPKRTGLDTRLGPWSMAGPDMGLRGKHHLLAYQRDIQSRHVSYGINEKGYFYASFSYAAEEHGGTHFDAPLHFRKMAGL